MNKEQKIKELQDQLESVKQELETLKSEKEVLMWEDLEGIEGYHVNNHSYIKHTVSLTKAENQNIFKTKKQAEAAIALAKISQLLPVYNEGWEPDYEAHAMGENSIGECYRYHIGEVCYQSRLLCFKDMSTLQKFVKHNRDLIEQAKPLL